MKEPLETSDRLPECARTPDDDETLMHNIQQKDSVALEALFQKHRALLRGVALQVVHDHFVAEETLQDCMVDTWMNADLYLPAKGRPLGWLMIMCKRRAIDRLRRQKSYHGAKARFEDSLKVDPLWKDANTGEIDQAETRKLLDEKLKLLPANQEEALRLSFFSGLSQRQIAEKTKSPLGTVKTRMELGIGKLRVWLARIPREHLALQAS